MSQAHKQFTIQDLAAATVVVAVACGLLTGAPPELWIASLGVVFSFVVLDLFVLSAPERRMDLKVKLASFVAVHGTGFSVASLACLLIVVVKGPTHLWPQGLALAGQQLAIAIYLLSASAFGAVAFLAAWMAIDGFPPAKWLALMNTPAVIVFCVFLAQIVF